MVVSGRAYLSESCSRYDAEDLASEILCHVLEGLGRYEIESLDSWVWRIAHNRYARFIAAGKKRFYPISARKELTDRLNCQFLLASYNIFVIIEFRFR